MFSYFRNHGHHASHKRNGSASSTPASPYSPQWDSAYRPQWPEAMPAYSPSTYSYDNTTSESPISAVPPQLPPIPRVASRTERNATEPGASAPRHDPPGKMGDGDALIQPRAGFHTRGGSVPSITRTSATSDAPQRVLQGSESMMRERPNLGMMQANSSWSSQTMQHEILYQNEPYGPPRNQHTSGISPNSSWTATQRPRSPTGAPSHGEDSYSQLTQYTSHSPTSINSSYRPKNLSSSNLAEEAQRPPSRAAPPSQETHSKPHKAKLNLLNPMNLLMRRRTSQGGESFQDASFSAHRASAVPAMKLPDDYDPRIKGAGVHDFNAPRTRRQPSTSEIDPAVPFQPQDQQEPHPQFDTATARSRQPIFIEQFDDKAPQSDPSAIRRESLANTEFMKRISRQLDAEPASDVSTPRRTPSPAAQASGTPRTPHTAERASKETLSTAHRESTDRSTVHSSHSLDTRDTSPAGSLPPSRSSHASPGLDLSFDNLPKHMASNASRVSRFSFQQTESSLAQEKALEEKHKQKVGAEAAHTDSRFDELEEDDESAYDNYDFDDDDGDDDIPYIGDENDTYVSNHRISVPLNQPLPISDSSHFTSPPPAFNTLKSKQDQSSLDEYAPAQQHGSERTYTKASTATTDDLYFDDGLIEDGVIPSSEDGDADFDESLFDSMPHDSRYDVGRDRRLPADSREPQYLPEPDSVDSSGIQVHNRVPEITLGSEISRERDDVDHKPPKPSASATNRLNAYHSALASAANKAAEGGKFSRQASVGASSSVYDTGSAQSIASPADEAQDMSNVYSHLAEEPINFDDYDTDLEEDPMIAAANAEVLATEDAEFYGQEFGFYGGSCGSGEMFNGGFFGTTNAATGNASREPNLTPITERSEFSTRNSFVSIGGHGSSAALAGLAGSGLWNDMATGPGLRDLMSQDEDDMTLGQLMKLRREAFGGAGNRASFTAMSTGSSPTYSNGSAMLLKPEFTKHSPQGSSSSAGAIDLDQTPRRLEVTKSNESGTDGSTGDEDIEQHGYSSPSSPTVRQAQFGHRATPSMSELKEAQQSPAQHSKPTSVPASSTNLRNTLPITSSVSRKPVPTAPVLDVPILSTPRPNAKRTSDSLSASTVSSGPSPVSPMTSPDPNAGNPRATMPSPPSPMSPPTFSTSTVPFPSAATLQKHADRPVPDAYRQMSYQAPPSALDTRQDGASSSQTRTGTNTRHRRNGGGSADGTKDSVAYVLEGTESENNHDGKGTWFLERRRTMETGEVVVVGREPVAGGRI